MDFEYELHRLEQESGEDGARLARLFVAECSERVLPVFEARHPGEKAPAEAIQASRDFADGKITSQELYAAQQAAKAAPRYGPDYPADAWSAWNMWANRTAWAARTTWAEDQFAEFEWQENRLKQYLNGDVT